jgi:hypothetical protein
MVSNTTDTPPYTLYTYIYIEYLFTQGRVGGIVVNQREGERGNRGEYRST